MRFFVATLVALVAVTCCLAADPTPTVFTYSENTCLPFTADTYTTDIIMTLYFGAKDGRLNNSRLVAPYEGYGVELTCCWWNYDHYSYYSGIPNGGVPYWDADYYFYNINNFWINQIPLQPGRNSSYGNYDATPFVPTANFTCGDDGHSAMMGPMYADYFEQDFGERGRYPNLETYIHYSAPPESSYLRDILFVTNTGSEPEAAMFWSDWYTWYYATNVAPAEARSRYFAMHPYQDGDSWSGDPTAIDFVFYILNSVHARGPKARDTAPSVYADMDDYIVSYTYNTIIPPGKTIALMIVIGYGMDREMMLANAAYIDSEPAELFHGLTADQLSLIVNWGACEAAIGPNVTVKVNAPQSCSSGVTSTFTVDVTTTRTDITAEWTHRVTYMGGEISAPSTSNSFEIINDLGTVVHELWYKDCFVKSTPFEACARASAPVATRPVAAPSKVSGATQLVLGASSLFGLSLLFF